MGSILIAMPKRNDANSIAEMLAANGLMMDTGILRMFGINEDVIPLYSFKDSAP